MMKITNAYLIGLVTASLLVGCGGSDSDSDDNREVTEQMEQNEHAEENEQMENHQQPTGNTGSNTQMTGASKTFTADVMPVLTSKCKSCHGNEGDFTVTTPSATYANISDLKGSMVASGQYLLDKGSNTVSHGGGMQMPQGSAEYAIVKSWVDSGADFN